MAYKEKNKQQRIKKQWDRNGISKKVIIKNDQEKLQTEQLSEIINIVNKILNTLKWLSKSSYHNCKSFWLTFWFCQSTNKSIA